MQRASEFPRYVGPEEKGSKKSEVEAEAPPATPTTFDEEQWARTRFTEESWKEFQKENNPEFNAEAFALHQKSLEKKAEKPTLILRRKRKIVDVAHEQALKENEEFNRTRYEKTRSLEFERNQERLEVIKQAIEKKRALIREGRFDEAEEIKIALILTGGGLKVSRSFAQTDALAAMGYGPVTTEEGPKAIIDDIYGVSTGTMAAGAFAGSPEQGKKIGAMFFEKHLSPQFINFKRIWGHLSGTGRPIVDIDYVKDLLKQGGTGAAYDIEGIKQSPSNLYFQITNIKDGKPILVNVKDYIRDGGDPADIARMSMSLPGFTGPPPTYHEEKVTDGGVASIPMEKIIETSHPTHILIMPQTPFEESSNTLVARGGKFVALVISRALPILGKGLLEKRILKLGHLNDQAQEYVEHSKIPIAFSYPPTDELSTLNKKVDARTTRHATFENTCRNFGHPELIRGYTLEEQGEGSIADTDRRTA